MTWSLPSSGRMATNAGVRTVPTAWRGRRARPLSTLVGVVLLSMLAILPAFTGFHFGSAPVPSSGSRAIPPTADAGSALAGPLIRPGGSQVLSNSRTANSTVVDPYAYYGTTGPAPYGVTDFGVTANDTGYEYNTTSFLGTIQMQSMDALAKIDYKGHVYEFAGDTVQLNTILVLANGSQSFDYWVQNVPFFYPPSNNVQFENNVWNLTSSADLPANTIVGNGSIDGTVYIASATNQPGNNVSLGFPSNVSAKLTTGTALGIPFVQFDYNDGFGWQTYDNITFPWAHGGWTDQGFVVDGTQYIPDGLFYDAEWVYGGPGDGLSSDNLQSNFTMGLEFWNGHNYQAVPNAFNFGSDTGESMNNVSEATGLGAGAVGVPGATVTVGNSPLGFLYGRADVSIVNVTSPLPNATLTFGALSVPFTGTDANVTLAPGSYEVELWNGTHVAAVRNITVVAGEYLAFKFVTDLVPNAVSFESSGLPPGHTWYVSVDNVTYPASGNSLTLELVNGTYNYTILPIAGYFLSEYEGVLYVVGSSITLRVAWALFTYPVGVGAVNLPDGVAWTVTATSTSGGIGGSATSDSATSVLTLGNGSYEYTVEVEYRYVAIVSPDTFAILGSPVNLSVQFAIRDAFLVGEVEPATATVSVNGIAIQLLSDGTFNVTLVPGPYTVTASGSGYRPYSSTVTLTPGNATALAIELTPSTPTPPAPSNSSHTASSGPVSPWLWVGLGLVAVLAIVTSAILLARRRAR